MPDEPPQQKPVDRYPPPPVDPNAPTGGQTLGRYLLALLACAAIYFLYILVGVLLHWRSGGGMLALVIMIAAMSVTWRAITKRPGS